MFCYAQPQYRTSRFQTVSIKKIKGISGIFKDNKNLDTNYLECYSTLSVFTISSCFGCIAVSMIQQIDCVCFLDFDISWVFVVWEHKIGEGNGTPLQYSCLENPMDRGAWQAAVHGVAKSQTRLSDFLSLFTFMHWRRKWQPTPVFLPGESQGRGSLVGCCL